MSDVEKAIDDAVSRIYRRFKDWNKRGFTESDVTWCEVRADIVEIAAALAAQQNSPSGDIPKPTKDQAEYLQRIAASAEYDPETVVGGPKPALGGLSAIANQVQHWLDYQERDYASQGTPISDDTALISPPTWPTRGVLKRWVAVLRQGPPLGGLRVGDAEG